MQKQLSISEESAKEIYPKADKAFQKVLEETFPELFGNITDRVKSFEDACLILGENPNSDIYENGLNDEIAYRKLKVIVQALNEGWKPDWNNSSEAKYYSWFKMGSSGSGFAFGGCDFGLTVSIVGSRLVFKTRALAEYAGKQFVNIYKQFMI